MAVTIYHEQDVDPRIIQGRKVAIIGYGRQGHAHALNLRDSGCDVRVGLREGSKSWAKAEEAGLKVTTMDQAAEEGDIVLFAGKGHEDYQLIHGKKEHFVERDIIKEACAALKK